MNVNTNNNTWNVFKKFFTETTLLSVWSGTTCRSEDTLISERNFLKDIPKVGHGTKWMFLIDD